MGHPSVVFAPDGWHGYRYWMAFTPFPAEARENPNIVASNDGVTWEVSSGLTNLVTSNQDAIDLGHTYWSGAPGVFDVWVTGIDDMNADIFRSD